MPPTHVIATCGLIRREDGRILMNFNPERGWEIPGGQVETGETLLKALQREIREETGVEAAVGPLVGIYNNLRISLVVFSFLCDYRSGQPTTSEEATQIEWVDPAQALSRVEHPAVRQRLQDMLSFNGEIMYRVYHSQPFEELESFRLDASINQKPPADYA